MDAFSANRLVLSEISEIRPVILVIRWLIAWICCSAVISQLEQEKQAAIRHEPGDMRVEVVANKTSRGFTLFEQTIVFVVGGLVGGTLSLVSFLGGVFSLRHPTKWPSVTAVLLSVAAPCLFFRL